MPELFEMWREFNLAMVGATAALAGLLIVAMSVNIAKITGSSSLSARVASSLAALVLAIIVTALGVAPAQPLWAYGLEVLIGALIATGFQVHAVRMIVADREHSPTAAVRFAKSSAGMLPLLPYLGGAVALLAGGAGPGFWLLAIGTMLAIVSAIMHAWVVLVEVLR